MESLGLAEIGELGLVPTDSDAGDEAPFAQNVERGKFFGQ